MIDISCNGEKLHLRHLELMERAITRLEYGRLRRMRMNLDLMKLWESSPRESQLRQLLGQALSPLDLSIDNTLSDSEIILMNGYGRAIARLHNFSDLTPQPCRVYPYRRLLP